VRASKFCLLQKHAALPGESHGGQRWLLLPRASRICCNTEGDTLFLSDNKTECLLLSIPTLHCILALLLLKVLQGGMHLLLLHREGPCCPQLVGTGLLMPGSPAG